MPTFCREKIMVLSGKSRCKGGGLLSFQSNQMFLVICNLERINSKKVKTVLFALCFLVACTSKLTPELSEEELDKLIIGADIQSLSSAIADHQITIPQLTNFYLKRIQAIDKEGPGLNAVLAINPDALAIAESLQKELEAGKSRGPLHGIPVLIKDNIDTHDQMPTTAGSRALAASYPLDDAFIVKKLRESGAIILGKTNLSEWANFRGEKSSSGWSGIGGQTLNPYVLSTNPCGSSSGSGVAVSADLCVLAIGTETNGSIVCPSQANGIVGIKPTVGLWSRDGIIPISNTQDTPGPMARTMRDAVILLAALVGEDPADPATSSQPVLSPSDYMSHLKADGLKGKRIGIDRSVDGINQEVDSLFMKAIQWMESQGASFVEVDQIMAPGTDEASFTVMLHEYKEGLNAYFRTLGPGSSIKLIGDVISFNENDSVEMAFYGQEYLIQANEMESLESKSYLDALSKARQGSREMGIDLCMEKNKLDGIIAPTGSPAWTTNHEKGDNYSMGTSSPAAISGYPAITVPMGFVGELPVGITFYGKAWSEGTLIEMAYAFEKGTNHRKAPKFIP